MNDLPIIDAHQHFWDLQYGRYPWLQGEPPAAFRYGDTRALRQSYLPEQYARNTKGWSVKATVHVEAEWDRTDPAGETRWLAGLRAASGFPTVAVAHATLDREDAASVLQAQAGFDFVRGIRHKPAAAASPREIQRGAPGSMDDPKWRAGFALLSRYRFSFDLQTPYWHLAEAADLARAFPWIPIIVNHTALPVDRSAEGLRAWRAALELAAAEPNIALKISGLGIKGQPWSLAANAPVIRDAIRIFGADRCCFASNFPVDSLVGSFDTIFAGFKAAVADLPAEAQRKLFRDTAARLYRIPL
ncbi:MAG TPA: amidohydrolase family protein [Stellaceae bacterium]|nr:amidohydrolase family protein [Stellaceae bacterium]